MAEEKKVKPGSLAELEQLYPGPKTVTVKIKPSWEAAEVKIEPLAVEDLGRVSVALLPLLEHSEGKPNAIALQAKRPKEMAAVIAACIDWPVERVQKFDAAGYLLVMMAVFEVNQDFFGQLLALLAFAPLATTTTAAAGSDGAGSTPSDTSDTGSTPIQSATH